ncbi:hypothetical protein [Rhodovulum euryhalinum]|uniref:Uncharacterized protein n=1 Tax=Rhodovulum euryhalinum TaxID=35805 RepID=A0A4R2K6U7_9RHOB|nr:hypothetical protein [Rhodovulum euryhalinum]TCO69021.1 hypothetical protein EV655_11918 [Rhodovulum euryhalinum]
MPFRVFALILAGVIAAGALTAGLVTALPGHGMAILIPLALAAALLLRLFPRR